ncbi:MAG TPA: tryptophan 2,3-dioxygenase family protein, partial [Planctomycetota bacterium]|nr:tryptophan 2,3-dioxygenase family protein [Planctomycetota bacterium]
MSRPPPESPRPPTNYWDYIKVEELLALQTGVDGDEQLLSDDEVRFIVVHQIDELWFKLALRELLAARNLFKQTAVPESALAGAAQALGRVTLLFRLLAQHFELMETMRTQDYLKFRDKLSPASGFQSAQMRELEILLGLDDAQRLPFGAEGSYRAALRAADGGESPAQRRVERRAADRPSLKQCVDLWLHRTPIQGSTPEQAGDPQVVARFIGAYLQGHEELHRRSLAEALAAPALAAAEAARLRARYDGQLQGA